MYDWPSRTPRNVRGSSRPMRGSATLTTVESRNTIPDPSTAAVRIQRERLICTSEIPPAEEVFQHPRAGCLVEGDAMAAWQHERGAWAHRDLEPVLAFQSALLQLGSGLAQVVDAVNVDRSFAFEVVGEEHMRRTVRQLDHRHPRAHSLDRERELAAKHVGEEPRVGRDVAAGRVQIVELEERRQLSPLAIPKKQPRCSRSRSPSSRLTPWSAVSCLNVLPCQGTTARSSSDWMRAAHSLVLMAGRIASIAPDGKSTVQNGRLGLDWGRRRKRPAGWAAGLALERGTPWSHS